MCSREHAQSAAQAARAKKLFRATLNVKLVRVSHLPLASVVDNLVTVPATISKMAGGRNSDDAKEKIDPNYFKLAPLGWSLITVSGMCYFAVSRNLFLLTFLVYTCRYSIAFSILWLFRLHSVSWGLARTHFTDRL